MPKRTTMRWTVVAAITLSIAALAVNTLWVDSKTRAASPREGGQIVQTSVVPANVKAEGAGPALVLLHGFDAVNYITHSWRHPGYIAGAMLHGQESHPDGGEQAKDGCNSVAATIAPLRDGVRNGPIDATTARPRSPRTQAQNQFASMARAPCFRRDRLAGRTNHSAPALRESRRICDDGYGDVTLDRQFAT